MIPVCEPFFDGRELEYVTNAVKSTWISSKGEYINRIEKEFPAYVKRGFGITATSGTTALHLALQAIGIKKGDEVIIPAFTMIACAFAVCYCGAVPVFVDCDRETLTMDPALIEEKITPRTKAVMPVHIYGHPCDMDPIISIAKKHNLLIVEDAAEGIGSRYKGKICGSFGDISCFSFFANKIITCGEGGIVCTDNKAFADNCRYYKNLCFPLDNARVYLHEHIGFNYRMTNVQAALAVAQLEKVNQYVQARRTNAQQYNKALKGAKGIILPVEKEWAVNSYWMYAIMLEKGFPLSRDQFMEKLKGKGIETRLFFSSMNKQKGLEEYGADCSGTYPVSDEAEARGFYLPSGSGLKESDIQFICNEIKEIAEKC